MQSCLGNLVSWAPLMRQLPHTDVALVSAHGSTVKLIGKSLLIEARVFMPHDQADAVRTVEAVTILQKWSCCPDCRHGYCPTIPPRPYPKAVEERLGSCFYSPLHHQGHPRCGDHGLLYSGRRCGYVPWRRTSILGHGSLRGSGARPTRLAGQQATPVASPNHTHRASGCELDPSQVILGR